jgi:hypothetical protein
MIWIAPLEKDDATNTLEKRLWDATDQFRSKCRTAKCEVRTSVTSTIGNRDSQFAAFVIRNSSFDISQGGMFVQSARFVEEHKKNPAAELSINSVVKTDETRRLCRLNLAFGGIQSELPVNMLFQ